MTASSSSSSQIGSLPGYSGGFPSSSPAAVISTSTSQVSSRGALLLKGKTGGGVPVSSGISNGAHSSTAAAVTVAISPTFSGRTASSYSASAGASTSASTSSPSVSPPPTYPQHKTGSTPQRKMLDPKASASSSPLGSNGSAEADRLRFSGYAPVIPYPGYSTPRPVPPPSPITMSAIPLGEVNRILVPLVNPSSEEELDQKLFQEIYALREYEIVYEGKVQGKTCWIKVICSYQGLFIQEGRFVSQSTNNWLEETVGLISEHTIQELELKSRKEILTEYFSQLEVNCEEGVFLFHKFLIQKECYFQTPSDQGGQRRSINPLLQLIRGLGCSIHIELTGADLSVSTVDLRGGDATLAVALGFINSETGASAVTTQASVAIKKGAKQHLCDFLFAVELGLYELCIEIEESLTPVFFKLRGSLLKAKPGAFISEPVKTWFQEMIKLSKRHDCSSLAFLRKKQWFSEYLLELQVSKTIDGPFESFYGFLLKNEENCRLVGPVGNLAGGRGGLELLDSLFERFGCPTIARSFQSVDLDDNRIQVPAASLNRWRIIYEYRYATYALVCEDRENLGQVFSDTIIQDIEDFYIVIKEGSFLNSDEFRKFKGLLEDIARHLASTQLTWEVGGQKICLPLNTCCIQLKEQLKLEILIEPVQGSPESSFRSSHVLGEMMGLLFRPGDPLLITDVSAESRLWLRPRNLLVPFSMESLTLPRSPYMNYVQLVRHMHSYKDAYFFFDVDGNDPLGSAATKRKEVEVVLLAKEGRKNREGRVFLPQEEFLINRALIEILEGHPPQDLAILLKIVDQLADVVISTKGKNECCWQDYLGAANSNSIATSCESSGMSSSKKEAAAVKVPRLEVKLLIERAGRALGFMPLKGVADLCYLSSYLSPETIATSFWNACDDVGQLELGGESVSAFQPRSQVRKGLAQIPAGAIKASATTSSSAPSSQFSSASSSGVYVTTNASASAGASSSGHQTSPPLPPGSGTSKHQKTHLPQGTAKSGVTSSASSKSKVS